MNGSVSGQLLGRYFRVLGMRAGVFEVFQLLRVAAVWVFGEMLYLKYGINAPIVWFGFVWMVVLGAGFLRNMHRLVSSLLQYSFVSREILKSSLFVGISYIGCTTDLLEFKKDNPEFIGQDRLEGKMREGSVVLKSDGGKYVVLTLSKPDFNTLITGKLPKIMGGLWLSVVIDCMLLAVVIAVFAFIYF